MPRTAELREPSAGDRRGTEGDRAAPGTGPAALRGAERPRRRPRRRAVLVPPRSFAVETGTGS